MRIALWLSLVGLVSCTGVDPTHDPETFATDAGAALANDAGGSEQPDALTSLSIGNLTFQLRVAGPVQGEPVILLHGFPQTSLEWHAQIQILAAAGYRVVAPDQRGYSPGARPTEVADYAMPLLVRDVLTIADALGFARFHLAGHDWGASVTWVTAYLAPERLLSITAISVPHLDAYSQARNDPSSCQPAASAYIGRFMADGFEAELLRDGSKALRQLYEGLPEARVESYTDHFRDESALRGPLHWYRANLATGAASPSIGKTRVPTLYIWSDGDVSVCRDAAARTADHIDAPYQFETIAGVSHWVPELAVERVAGLMLTHLRKYPAK